MFSDLTLLRRYKNSSISTISRKRRKETQTNTCENITKTVKNDIFFSENIKNTLDMPIFADVIYNNQ